ncbi:Pol polyprotein [Plakobranchus ocellatus]|uniref:Pol polyprotein n=1 Tax=Plakobranchus ocellatus TaxID=259542 RepID=A0AAV4B663_9GAST|nr:Pol polyprotein [Plakobranchus ocellatus]
MSAKTTAEALLSFCQNFGIPKRIHSDQGANFGGKVIQELCSLLGAEKFRTKPYHPQGNGACERFNRTVIRMLGTLPTEKKINWPMHIGMLGLAYNATPSDATGYSPYFLLFGRNPYLPVDNLFPRETQTKTTKEWSENTYLVVDQPLEGITIYRVKRQNGGRERTLHRNLLLPVQLLRDPAFLEVAPVHKEIEPPQPEAPSNIPHKPSQSTENDLEVEVSESEEEEEAAAYIRQRASQPPREVAQPPLTPAPRRSTRIRQPPMWMRTNEYVTDHNPVIDALQAVISGKDLDATKTTAIIQHFLSRDNGSREGIV